MADTTNFNLFFPFNDLNPQGWLSDFITPQLMGNKNSLMYSMIYRNSNFFPEEHFEQLKKELNGKKTSDGKNLYDSYVSKSAERLNNENKFIFLNGKYSDILENVVTSKNGATVGSEQLSQEYLVFLNTIKPYQMAFFQPYVKLYYGWKDDPKNKKEQFKFIEFPFSQKFDLEDILGNPNAFLEGSGIKSISNNMSFHLGTQRNSSISINYFFSNINIVTRKIGISDKEAQPKYGFSFIKLFQSLGIKKEILKLEYGYYVDPKLEDQHHIKPEICNIINQRERKTFGILKTKHNFKFDKEGGVEISVNYTSLAEAALTSDNSVSIPSAEQKSNIKIIDKIEAKSKGASQLLFQYEDLKKTLELTKEKIENLALFDIKDPPKVSKEKEFSSDLQKEKSRKLQKLREDESEQNKTINSIKRQMVPYFKDLFIDTIKNNYDMYSLSFNTKKIESDKSYNFLATFNLIHPDTGEEIQISKINEANYVLDDILKDIKTTVLQETLENITNRIFNTPKNHENTDQKFGHIIFFPVRAILRAAYQMLSKEEQNYIPHIMFGNLTCRVYNKTYYINTGNILIELNQFQRWMHNKFYSKGFLDFSFGHFVKELIDELVPDAIYRNSTYPNNRTRITVQDYLTSYSIDENYMFSEQGQSLKTLLEEFPYEEVMINLSSKIFNAKFDPEKTEHKPLIIFSKLDLSTVKETTAQNFSVNNNNELELNEIQDAKNGIPHIIIGADGGMFLNADFQQIDLKGLRSGIALQAMVDESSNYFFYQYSLSAQVFGSGIFNHGSIVCIPTPPLGLAGSEYDIGIVGYYKVKSLADSISADGSYTTTITADWFWGGKRDGKNGQPTLEQGKIGKKVNQILDYIESETYKPSNYISLLIEKDINSLTNFKINDKTKKKPGKKQDKKKDKKTHTRTDEKEKDKK